ncbi:MAG: LysR family transcriptional regulator [Gracilibacteraceae bacterium]|jgi:DNA-binding transcriptional LysR family regulator|nr:LysR family transcriptional regulator [Gracilibacteraceae bacterium]
MQIEQLVYLVEVSKTNSISKAARNTYVTPQNISSAIRKLEKEYGVCLLHRSASGVSLTADGEIFVRIAEEALEKISALDALKYPAPRRANESFTFYHPASPSPELLTVCLTDFFARNPGTKVTILETSHDEIVNSLRNDSRSAGLMMDESNRFSADEYRRLGLEIIKAAPDRLTVVTNLELPIARQKSTSFGEVLKYPIVIFEYIHRNICVRRILSRYGEPNIVLATNNAAIFWQTIKSGAAIGLGMEDKIRRSKKTHGDIHLIPLRPRSEEFTFFIACAANNDFAPREISFLQQLL